MTQRASLRRFPASARRRWTSSLPRLRQEALDLLNRVRLDFVLFEARGFRDRRRVPDGVPTAHGFVERGTEGAVHLVGSAGGAAGLLHLPVEALQVLRLQLLQAVGAEAGDEVMVHRDPVAVDGVLGDVRRCDVLDPVGEPGRERPALAGLAHRALVALALQLADGLGDLGSGLPADVATVRGAVVLDADGDSAVPAAVIAEVDGRGSIGLAGLRFGGASHAAAPKSVADSRRARKSFTASAGMRRRLPILTEAISPEETYS